MDISNQIRAACEPHSHRINNNIRIVCPACSHTRKGRNQKDPCMSVLIKDDRLVYECKHCDASGATSLREKQAPRHHPINKTYQKKSESGELSELSLNYLMNDRHLRRSILQQFGVFDVKKYFPKLEREALAIGFPYFENEKIYATKFRALEAKAHTQDGGGANTLFGQHLINGETTLTVCEGEIDALSLWSAEVSAVSVPNGAPSKISDKKIDASEDKKFNYVWEARDLFKRMEKIILAVDADSQGEALAEELARRIGKAKCWRVDWPKDCKDANDVLVKHGSQKLKEVIEAATPYPLSGLNNADHYSDQVDSLYREGVAKGESTGFPCLDDLITIKTGYVSVVTGIPSSGKSNFIDSIMVRLATTSSWKFAICSFENDPSTHITQLIEKHSGKPFWEGDRARITENQLRESKQFVDDHFVFIDNNEGEKATLDSILDRAHGAVQRMGIRGLVIDPFSYISLPNKEKSETQQIADMLTSVRMFAKLHDIHVWFVAHPAKMRREEGGVVPIPKGYDLSGSAHWFNFADVGMTVARFFDNHAERERVKIVCWKMRYRWMGSQGERVLDYDLATGDYFQEEESTPDWLDENLGSGDQWWDKM